MIIIYLQPDSFPSFWSSLNKQLFPTFKALDKVIDHEKLKLPTVHKHTLMYCCTLTKLVFTWLQEIFKIINAYNNHSYKLVIF